MTKIRNQKAIEKFGQQVKKLREAKTITQEDLAEAANIPLNQIGRIERGENNVTISTIFAIAKALGVKPKDLLDF